MAEDRWNDNRYGDEPLWGGGPRRERERPRTSDASTYQRDYGQADFDRRDRRLDEDDARHRPFSDNRPILGRNGSYPAEGRSFGSSGRYDDLSPGYRDFEASQRRIHRGEYDPDRYTPNPREGRGQETRSWWDRTQDELSSWFGDENARRRREWDERQADVRAEHRGRGPKGYQRSDARIAEDLNDRLTDDPYLDASDIEVRVQDGEVTLSGEVARREDKRRAEDLADNISGVGHVQNNLRVRPQPEAGTINTVIP